MLIGTAWADFFNNLENKTYLLKFLCSYFRTDECRNLFEIPSIINTCGNICGINRSTNKILLISNHEETETIFDTAG